MGSLAVRNKKRLHATTVALEKGRKDYGAFDGIVAFWEGPRAR